MKRILFLLMAAATATTAYSQDLEPEDSLAVAPMVSVDEVFERPDSVVVNRAGNQLIIQVYGAPDNPEYFYAYEQGVADDDTLSITKTNPDDWNFDFPFIAKANKGNKKARFSVHSSGLGYGFVNALNAPETMDVKMSRSYEIFWHEIIGLRWRPTRQGASFTVGVGIDWKNYRMTGGTRFIKDGANVTLTNYVDGAQPEFSRLKLFNITLPVMFHQELGRTFEISAGAVVNFNTHASMKTKYMLDDEERIKNDKGIHTNKVTVDIMGQINMKAIGVYVKYSPMSVLDTAYGPDFKSLSVGLTLGF